MCGTVGMFIGCAALSYCPKELLLQSARPDVGDPDQPYRSPFRNWHERASVRQAPRRVLIDDETSFFPPELVPVSRHPLVRALPAATFEEVLIQHLYRYLDFTARLEYLVVNRTVLGIARGSVGVDLPEEMRFDAYKMYCDEAYHTLFSVDLARQVRARTGIVPRLPAEPFFLARLGQILAELPERDRALAELLFVIVSETLISATLADLPDWKEVSTAVRGTIQDHAQDEGRHHAYFADFLRHMWRQLSPAERRRAGALVPRLIDAFLRPDLPAIRAELAGYGFDAGEVERIVSETYPPEVITLHTTTTSRQTMRHFDALGAFDGGPAAEELHRYGLTR
ncbi:diiron oxygenase [Micromonospora sp. KLBMP9576]|uniref:diiron oxygenase n=1 Tax=Micromonospora sp. KLBMP9576 TaxID=3424769 RepID=UPI003D8DB763